MCRQMRKRNRESGLTTMEMVIAMALFGIVLVSQAGLHLIALSAGAAADTSTIAANLARARMDELLALPAEKLKEQHHVDVQRQVPADGGRVYTVRTTVEAPDPARLDLTVTVTWHLAYARACAAGLDADCAGTQATYARTLQTRVQVPTPP